VGGITYLRNAEVLSSFKPERRHYPDKWNLGSWVEFNSPSQTILDSLNVSVDVEHPNSTISHYDAIYWNGTYGNLSVCSPINWTDFSAHTGDTITVVVEASNSGNATINISVPKIGSTF